MTALQQMEFDEIVESRTDCAPLTTKQYGELLNKYLSSFENEPQQHGIAKGYPNEEYEKMKSKILGEL